MNTERTRNVSNRFIARSSVAPLHRWLTAGVTGVLLGSSGAGKSTIANALAGMDWVTREVRAHDSRCRHTTTRRMLVELPGGASLIDTPGMRELGVVATEASLDLGFRGSLVSHRIAGSSIARIRLNLAALCVRPPRPGPSIRIAWESYLKLKREVRHNLIAADTSAQLAEKQRWKTIHKAVKRMYRERGR